MRSSKPARFVVRMLKDHGIWSAGERPTFDETEAGRLVAIGAGEIVGPQGDEATLAEPAPAPALDLKIQPLAGMHPEAKSMEKPKASRRGGNRRDHAPQNVRDDDQE